MNKHQLAQSVKRLLWGGTESYKFKDSKLSFVLGTRPIRRKYRESTNDVVRNDVLQIEYLEANFQPQHVLWDIGSHHGHYSIFASSVANSKNQVYSFEPDSKAREIQMKNIELNGFSNKIVLNPWAVSGTDGTLKFLELGGNSNSHLVKEIPQAEKLHAVEVQSRTLNSLAEEFPIPDFVKIDVEGAEIDILSAAGTLLDNKNVHFICELHPFAWSDFGVNYDQFKKALESHGRQIRLLDTRKSMADLPYYGTVLF